MTSIKQAFVQCVIQNATNASNRASRSEFWWFFLLVVIMGGASYASATMVPHAGWVLATLLALPTIWLFLMTFIRRLHDHNLPAIILILPVLPFAVLYQLTGEYFIYPQSFTELCVGLYAISGIVLIYFIYLLFKPGTLGDNRYGADPCLGPKTKQAKQATKEAAKKVAAQEAQAQSQTEANIQADAQPQAEVKASTQDTKEAKDEPKPALKAAPKAQVETPKAPTAQAKVKDQAQTQVEAQAQAKGEAHAQDPAQAQSKEQEQAQEPAKEQAPAKKVAKV